MKEFNKNDIVWCNTGNPSYEVNGSFVGKVLGFHNDKYVINKNGTIRHSNPDQLTKLCHCPIDDAANLHSDWITEDLIKHAHGTDNKGVGWVYKSGNEYDGEYDAYPVKYFITRNGLLNIKRYTSNNEVFYKAIEIINDLFN